MSLIEHRYLLNLKRTVGSGLQLSLRDIEDGSLMTFARFAELVAYLESSSATEGSEEPGASSPEEGTAG